MKQKFLIFAAFIFLIIFLIGLNAVSYVQKEKTPDKETNPNRSTYNTGTTGTRAFYDLLNETGRRVSRWQESPAALLTDNKNKPETFVIIGKTRREFDDKEIEQLLKWVSEGGKLVIIDREPPEELVKTTANWKINVTAGAEPPFFDFDPSDQQQMTEKTVAAKPAQPTVYTNQVNAVQPSRFASFISFARYADAAEKPPLAVEEPVAFNALEAPVAHLAKNEKTLLADFPFGAGKIVFLSDPYIVSNGGINLVDNAQLAVNIVAAGEGITAVDEFHQGYGAGENRLLSYFSETPLVAVLWQSAAIIFLVFLSQSRRFARPLPEAEPNRLSKLEYVSAMAELQQRTRAFDLALENIYIDFRRRAARLVGADNSTVSRADLAKLLAERIQTDAAEIENLLFKCEDIIHGELTNRREVLQLVGQLRELEEKLNLQRSKQRTVRI